MIFDFLFKKTGNELDDNKYFDYALTEQQLSILESEEHAPFKKVMLEVMEKKAAENINLLIHRDSNKNEEGKYKGVVLVYEDWIQFFNKKLEPKPEKKYTDPYNIIPVR